MPQLPALAHQVRSACLPTPQRIMQCGFAGQTVPIEDQIYGMILPRQGFPAPRAVVGRSQADAIRLAPARAMPGAGKPILGWFRSVITGQPPPPDPKWVEVKARKWGILHRPGVPDQKVHIIGRRSSPQGMYVQVSLHPIGYMGGDEDCGGPCPDHDDGMGHTCKGFCNCSQAAAMGRPECFCDWDCGTVSAAGAGMSDEDDCVDFYDEHGKYTHSICGPGEIAIIKPTWPGKPYQPLPTPPRCPPGYSWSSVAQSCLPVPTPVKPKKPKRVARPVPGPLPPVPPPPPTPRAAKQAKVMAIKAGIAGNVDPDCVAGKTLRPGQRYPGGACQRGRQLRGWQSFPDGSKQAICCRRTPAPRLTAPSSGAVPTRRAVIAGGSDQPPTFTTYPGNMQRREERQRRGWAGGSDQPPKYTTYPGNMQRREERQRRGRMGGSMYPPSYSNYPGKAQERDRQRGYAGGCGGKCNGKCDGSCGASCSCKK